MEYDAIEAIILTKSSKYGNYCVAGIDINTGHWVRLVTRETDTHGALSDKDLSFEDNTTCEILDIVAIPIIGPYPVPHQPENVLIDRGSYWEKIGAANISEVIKIHPTEQHDNILGNRSHYIPEREIAMAERSLTIIAATNLVISVQQGTNKRKLSFQYNAFHYKNYSVTDPDYYDATDGKRIQHATLVISLPDADFYGKYFKFVAKIFRTD